uniref:Glutamine amidotransferase type-2 domain-containing protein n=1 Tax=Plectus sambesii TaxID=2011161 RepID=A0A914XD37_9BILA
MCGIFAICAGKKDLAAAQTLSHRQAHRGPDFRGHYSHPTNGHVLCHERLAIIDLSCTQPLQGSQPDKQVVHNGEIYNYEALRDTVLADYHMKTTCDSEVIIFLWEKFDGPDFCNMLDGDFAFALIDGDRFMAARDPIGVKPLYYGVGADGTHYFSSEMKVIIDDCDKELHTFPPGFYFTRESGFVRYYQPAYFDHLAATGPLDLAAVRDALINATHKRLMSDVPLGLLLSGGLDSKKWILRKAFDDPIEPYLPREILWRQKEQFSDGVGYNWIDQMMAFCSAQVTDQQMSQATDRFPHNTPATKEAYYIRSIFEKHFPGRLAAETVLKWVPKWQANTDPSGRASQFHLKSVIERVDSNSSANESAGSEWSLQLDDAAAESLDQVAAPVEFAHATPVFV